jgi:hypothetical protein
MLESVSTYDEAGWGDVTTEAAPKQRRWLHPRRRTSTSTVIGGARATVEAWGAGAPVIPGEAATVHVLDDIRARTRLLRLVDALCADESLFPIAGSAKAALRVDQTRLATQKLIGSLPRGTPLPKVSPDGEGSLVFLWPRERTLVANVDGWHLQFIESAGRPDAVYHDEVDIREQRVPAELLAALQAG